MKKYKSLISLLLVLGIMLTLWTAPVYAAGRIIVAGTDVKSVTPENATNYTIYNSLLLFGKGGTFEYNINVPDSGNYHISIDAKLVGSALLTMKSGDISVDIKDATDDRKEKYVAKIPLKAGDNTITFSCTGGTTWLYNIYADRASDRVDTDFSRTDGTYRNYYLPAVIQAEDYNLGANGSYSTAEAEITYYRGKANVAVSNSGDKNVVALRKDSWTEYTFECKEDGSYDVKVNSDNTGTLELYFDGNQYPIIANVRAGNDSEVGTLFFKKGTHSFRIKPTSGMMNIDYISFLTSSVRGADPDTLVTIPPTAEELEAMKKEGRPVWKEIWVDGSVKESGNGTIEKPYKTIEEAKEAVKVIRNQMKGDIVVKIAPGEYEIDEKIVFTNDDGGINGYKVIYQGANTFEKPIISGGTHIDGWVPHEKGVWKTKVEDADEIRQLYINGYAAQRARSKYLYTNTGEYDDPETPETVDGYGFYKINTPPITKPEYAEVIYNQLWTQNRVPVKKIVDGGDVWWYVFDQPHFDLMRRNYNKDLQTTVGGKVYIENAYELIDEPGEFYFDRDTKEIFYYPFPEEDLTTADTVIGRSELMIQLVGNSKEDRIEAITFDNIDFRYGSWLDASRTGVGFFQSGCIIDENTNPDRVQFFGRHVPAAIDVSYARDITIKNCKFQNLGSGAINMAYWVDDSLIEGNVFRELSGGAVDIGDWNSYGWEKGEVLPSDLCKNNTVTNNVVRRVGIEYGGCSAIASYYTNSTTVSHNDIKDTSYTGISTGWGWGSKASTGLDCSNHKIINNRIENISMTVRDGGHIYNLSDMEPTIIEGNYCIHSNDYGGVYLDTGASGLTITRNVFKECFYDNIAFGRSEKSERNKAFNNWADQEQHHTFQWTGEGCSFEAPMVIADDNWPKEAVEVMENAGVQRGYKRLLAGVEYPEWRTMFMDGIPRDFYKSKNVIEQMAQEYMPGGEGVGYHETKTGEAPRAYNIGLNKAIGDTYDGEWLAYKLDFDRDTDYQFELVYSYKMSSQNKNENVKSSAGINVYIDGEKVIDRVYLEDTLSWNTYMTRVIGEPMHITAGEHIVKIEFVNAWSFEKFRFRATDVTKSDAEYDDGTMLIREGAK